MATHQPGYLRVLIKHLKRQRRRTPRQDQLIESLQILEHADYYDMVSEHARTARFILKVLDHADASAEALEIVQRSELFRRYKDMTKTVRESDLSTRRKASRHTYRIRYDMFIKDHPEEFNRLNLWCKKARKDITAALNSSPKAAGSGGYTTKAKGYDGGSEGEHKRMSPFDHKVYEQLVANEADDVAIGIVRKARLTGKRSPEYEVAAGVVASKYSTVEELKAARYPKLAKALKRQSLTWEDVTIDLLARFIYELADDCPCIVRESRAYKKDYLSGQ